MQEIEKQYKYQQGNTRYASRFSLRYEVKRRENHRQQQQQHEKCGFALVGMDGWLVCSWIKNIQRAIRMIGQQTFALRVYTFCVRFFSVFIIIKSFCACVWVVYA